ncbi:unnamed protein product [Phaeothamnion confervicola]
MSGFSGIETIPGYHAHVYYTDGESRARAEVLRAGIEALGIPHVMGRWHDAPIGPHPIGSYQVAFDAAQFAHLVPWLALNRNGLSVLVHPNTEDQVTAHSGHALWLGPQLPLDLEFLRRVTAAAQ